MKTYLRIPKLMIAALAIGACCFVFYACEVVDIGVVTSPLQETPAPPENMVLIPAGEFQMGSNDADSRADEQPIHTVSVDAFYMDTHEVTNAEYAAFLNAWGNDDWSDINADGARIELVAGMYRPVSGYADHPVVEVSWYGAMAYAEWADKRLPTEAEWEYAARGGLSGQKYPWGDTIDSTHANYAGNAGSTTAVGSYAANGYGLHDMAGNVYEWCLDAYDEEFYATSPARNPLSGAPNIKWLSDNYEEVNSDRVLRGGSWPNTARDVRVAARGLNAPSVTDVFFGFRCVRSVSP